MKRRHRENGIIATFLIEKKVIFSTHFRYIDLKEKKSSIDLLWYFDEQQRMKIIYGLIETIEIITKLIRFIKIMKI